MGTIKRFEEIDARQTARQLVKMIHKVTNRDEFAMKPNQGEIKAWLQKVKSDLFSAEI